MLAPARPPLGPLTTVRDRPWSYRTAREHYAFLAQFMEIPEGAVFTVEYSVRSAMMAVYHHFGLERPIPRIYHGLPDFKVHRTAL